MNLLEIRKRLTLGESLTNLQLRVTYYARVSTNHLEQINSLNNQYTYFEDLIKNNSNWTYIKGYIDLGISGTIDTKREQFMKMINDAERNLFDLIITKEISRFSRNTLDSIKYTRKLLDCGVAVLFLNDNINTFLPDSELRLTIMASLAQDEVRRLSERVKFGMHESIKKGHILGNNMLYGYYKDKQTGSLKIIKKEANIIKKIFNLYTLKDYSLNKIAHLFNEEKIPTKTNKKWTVTTLKRILENPKYIGYYCGNKSEVIDYITKKVFKKPSSSWIMYETNKIPPLISKQLFKKTQEKLNTKTIKINKHTYPFSNKIYCSCDNHLYYPRLQCTNDITWLCSNYLKNKKEACISANIRNKELMNIFIDIISLVKIDLSKIKRILLNIYSKDITITNTIIYNILINYLVDKIVVDNKPIINISWYIKNINFPSFKKEYSYKRGYQVTSTKRYTIKYHSYVYTSHS